MVFSEMTYLDNLCIRTAERVPSLWLGSAKRKLIREEYRSLIGDSIDADSPVDMPAASLYDLVYLREYIYDPQILVIERPFIETDIRLRLHIMSLIAMFKNRGTTILVIDSSMTDSEAVSDRILIVGGGRVKGEKTPQREGAAE
jgi:ABC-type sugar transport system ATPase subunit